MLILNILHEKLGKADSKAFSQKLLETRLLALFVCAWTTTSEALSEAQNERGNHYFWPNESCQNGIN